MGVTSWFLSGYGAPVRPPRTERSDGYCLPRPAASTVGWPCSLSTLFSSVRS
jgi:hypothetical protein